MTRIIRVIGCHECPIMNLFHTQDMSSDIYSCPKIDYTDNKNDVGEYVKSKTLPDNCPLERDNTIGLALGWLRKNTIY